MKKKCRNIMMFGLIGMVMAVSAVTGQAKGEGTSEERSLSQTRILFRGYEWGTDRDSLIKKETEELSYGEFSFSDDHLMINDGSVGGYDATIRYMFDSEGQFVEGTYELTEGHHLDENTYYETYCDLVEKYTEKYGNPAVDEEVWESDYYRNDNSAIGDALLTGEVSYRTVWMDKEGSFVTIFLYGEDLNIYTIVVYKNINYGIKDMSGI